MQYIGIDPGQEGGIGIIYEDNTAIAYKYTSDKLIEITKHIKEHKLDVCVYVEEVHSMPQQGVRSMFTFGCGFGKILGILEALNVEYQLVPAHRWKKYIGVTADKSTSIQKCKDLFPDTSLLPTSKCRKPSDGLAEALLIAEYGKRVSRKQLKY